jgi:ubiquitin-protein ligase
MKTFNCFFDTGSPATYINQRFITELALTPLENGIYILNISLPNNPPISPHPCYEWKKQNFPPSIDMLIGMDIISKGHFIIAPCAINSSSSFELLI